MKQHNQERIELFISNNHHLKGKFIWQSTLLRRLAALLYANQNKEINVETMHESYQLLKKNTSFFSSFRGSSAITVATMLSLHERPHQQLVDTLAVYDAMKQHKFYASDYLVVAAYQIAANTTNEHHELTIARAKAFYDGMKAEHFFITGHNDYIFAAMLGLSKIDIHAGLMRLETLYRALKPEFYSGNGVQALTQVLLLCSEETDIVDRVLTMRDLFRQKKIRMDGEYTISSLGVLSLLPASIDILVDDVLATYRSLREQKGFGFWSISKQERLLFAAALVAVEYIDVAQQDILTTTLSTSLTNIIIAQQTAIAIAAATSSAAAASSN